MALLHGRPALLLASSINDERAASHAGASTSQPCSTKKQHPNPTIKRARRCAAGLHELLEARPATLPPQSNVEPVDVPSWPQQAAQTPHLLAGCALLKLVFGC